MTFRKPQTIPNVNPLLGPYIKPDNTTIASANPAKLKLTSLDKVMYRFERMQTKTNNTKNPTFDIQ
jgi:hypothetical protein